MRLTVAPSAPARSRRDDILAAAIREFGAAGFAGARMERIATTARVNKQLLFHYFDSKDGLLVAALDRILPRFAVPQGSATPTEQVRRTARALQDAARAVPGFVGMLAAASGPASELPAAAAQRLVQWRADVLGRLRDMIADGQGRGFFRDDLDPTAIAALILGASLGAAAIGSDITTGDILSDYCAWR